VLYSALQFAYKSSSAHRAALFQRGQFMKKLFAIIAALFAVHANAGGGSIVVCDSMAICRVPPPYMDYDALVLSFSSTAGGTINSTTNFWLSQDCQGDPDASLQLLDSPIPSAGYWILPLDAWAIYPDGTDFSIQWTIDGCPATDCINGTMGSSPDICQF